MMRGGMGSGGDLDDPLAALQEENMSDDDNAAPEMSDEEADVEKEDPLLLAIDDLEGRVVSALDDVKLHPGVRSSTAPGSPSVHEELATLLRPVLEVAAHTGPSVARTYYRGVDGVEISVEDVYDRLVSDLVLPVMLEMAQSDTIPAKRGASLEFFRNLWKECHKAGSWLDLTVPGLQAGPYGPGSTSSSSSHSQPQSVTTPAARAQMKRRQVKRMAREGLILRYWVEASIACTLPGVFTSEESEGAVSSRGIIAASASLRPSLKHIAQRIKDADDRGASRIYGPVMKMVEGVLKKLFLSTPAEAILSTCIKFLEIVCLCCSPKPQDTTGRRRGHHVSSSRDESNQIKSRYRWIFFCCGVDPWKSHPCIVLCFVRQTTEDFSLDSLPAGHPTITREALESIADYAFTTLRGLTLMGGQVKIDVNLLSDMMLTSGGDGSPSAQVVSILKPAALAYLEIESSLPKQDSEDSLEFNLDRASLEFDFLLSHKSYALTINAMAALALNRPVFFKEAAVCLARRAIKPPAVVEGVPITKSATLALGSQLKATCLTMLRNPLSDTTMAWEILRKTLIAFDMEIQADKALTMARQANSLKTAGRAARNRANIHYVWEASENDGRVGKRQRETDDALAQMRAAKAARGLGHGIQLPTNMSDAVDLILANLENLPKKRPASKGSKTKKIPVTLEFVVDAILTNGASLSKEEGRWYDRDGGSAWAFDADAENHYQLNTKFLDTMDFVNDNKKMDEPSEKRRKMFVDQCHIAASEAVGRIVANASFSRSKGLADLGNQITARLAFTLQGVRPSARQQQSFAMAKESLESVANKLDSTEAKGALQRFVESYPLAASCLAFDGTTQSDEMDTPELEFSLTSRLLNEALLQARSTSGEANSDESASWLYESSLNILVASTVHASERANEKPVDADRKKAAASSALNLQRDLAKLHRLTRSSLQLLCAMCDIESITKKASEASRKTSQESVAASAAAHATKVAAEKRATAVLLVLRDAAFQRDAVETRKAAVECAVGIAAGRLPASAGIIDKALKLVMNVFFARNDALATLVVDAATAELKRASMLAVGSFDAIQKANKEMLEKGDHTHMNPSAPISDEEKQAMERMRKPAVLYMALCVRLPDIIKTLFSLSCVEKADALSKTVRVHMSKLSRAAAAKVGSAAIALKVAEMVDSARTPLLLSFLENLAPSTDKNMPDQELIDACFQIQESKVDDAGNKDPRFIIPVVSAMKRTDLVTRLPEFVAAEDKIFLAALVRMGDRVGRQALLFRDEPDEETPSLHGLTLCEQLVFLHRLDFAAASVPQKRYLGAIKLCLEDDQVYNDRVLMSALDQISGTFLTGAEKLPLAFMRTCILVCTKHESLHSWICHVLLPRLVEGKIYSDARQWEGWMRCAHMLEKSGDSTGVSSVEAIQKLPSEQLLQYKTKWAGA
jgi:symplekin